MKPILYLGTEADDGEDDDTIQSEIPYWNQESCEEWDDDDEIDAENSCLRFHNF